MINRTVPSDTLNLSTDKYSDFSAEEALKGELNKLQQQPANPPAPTIADLLRRSKVDLSKIIEEPPTCLEVMDSAGAAIFGTLGNFSLVIGKAKSRKTYFTSLLISALVKSDLLQDKIRGVLPPGKRKILAFDTEQANYHVQKVLRRILDTAETTSQDNISVHCLRTYDTATRLQMIEEAIYTTEGLGVVVIDGIRDLVLDINSAEEATMIATKLLKWSEERNIHIITVLHQNKADNNARGHVGTELINKAESVLSVAKDSGNPELSIVTPEYFRGKDFAPFAFSVDQRGLPYINDEWTPGSGKEPKERLEANNVPDSFHRERLADAFKIDSNPSYKTMWVNLQTAFAGYHTLGDNKAKRFVSYYMQKRWVEKIDPPQSGKMWATYKLNAPT